MTDGLRRRVGFGALAALFLTAGPGEALPRQSSSTSSTKPSEILALSGCINATPDARRTFTLADPDQRQTFRLTGTDVRQFVGQHVEILGTWSKRVRVVGGLYPSPNVAGQAGAMDPTQAAMAAQSGPAGSSKPLAEFKVRSVRLTPGSCPDR